MIEKLIGKYKTELSDLELRGYQLNEKMHKKMRMNLSWKNLSIEMTEIRIKYETLVDVVNDLESAE